MASEIAEFYNNKNIFLTGGTGFLGIAIIEKILRSTPNVSWEHSFGPVDIELLSWLSDHHHCDCCALCGFSLIYTGIALICPISRYNRQIYNSRVIIAIVLIINDIGWPHLLVAAPKTWQVGSRASGRAHQEWGNYLLFVWFCLFFLLRPKNFVVTCRLKRTIVWCRRRQWVKPNICVVIWSSFNCLFLLHRSLKCFCVISRQRSSIS